MDAKDFDDEQAEIEGWGIFNDGEIQRVDGATDFNGDGEALLFVFERAAKGSAYHKQALEIFSECLRKNYADTKYFTVGN